MKQFQILAMTMAMAAAVPAHGQDSVAMSGILDTYLDASRAGDAHATRVHSGGISGSRISWRGGEDLGGGNRAIFLLEAGINMDDGSSGQGGILFGRQAWVGLAGQAGELTLGRQYSPNFYTIVTYGLGGGLAWGNASNYFTDNSPLRVNNAISYASPSMAGFKVRAFMTLGENTTQPGGTNIGAIHSGSLQYDSGPLSAGIAVESRKMALANTERFYAAGASYRFTDFKLGILGQGRRDDIGATASDAIELGVSIPLGMGSLLLDAGRFRHRDVTDGDATALSVRYDHNLSKRSMIYVGAAQIRNQARARFGINGNTGPALAVSPGADPRSVILGVRHLF